MLNLNWISLVSTCISKVSYDKVEKKLYIEFPRGHRGFYKKVPSIIYQKLLKADSHGKFFHAYIRDKYEFEYI